MTLTRIAAASLLIAGAATLVVAQPASVEQSMSRAAKALLATLDPPQVEKVKFAFNAEERFNWHYIPRTRLGLPFKEMNERQRDAAFALIKVGLSQKGFTKTETIRSFEPILKAMENGRINRDSDLYFVTIFGDPDQATWGWRYEGHHIAQNWTIANGKAISTTPAFLGANPAVVRDGPQKGTRPLAAEEDLARALVLALTPAQQKEAIVNATAPTEILTTNTRKSPRLEHGGILASTLNREQQAMLSALIEEHAMVQSPALASLRIAKVKADTMAKIRFAWLGTTEVGGPHYYSIQGDSFLIEYDNTQNGANHQHVVWRDFNGDFGVDVLAEHYARDPAHRTQR